MPTRVGFRLRSLAFAVDLAAVLTLSVLLGPWLGWRLGLGHAGGGPGVGGMMAAGVGGGALIGLAYFASEGWMGVSPGKRLFGLRIGTDEGHVAYRDQYAVRYLLKHSPTVLGLVAVLVALVVPWAASWLVLLSNLAGVVVVAGCFLALGAARQALHDRVAETAVFRARDLLPPLEDPEHDWDEPGEPASGDPPGGA